MDGTCDLAFRPVEEAFNARFSDGLEAGAACAAVVDGRLSVLPVVVFPVVVSNLRSQG
jgi:hypothetical protein